MQYEHSGWRNRTKRLPREAYAQAGSVCSLTIAVRDRQPVFADRALASAALSVLRSLSVRRGVLVYAYCLMPDHVHLVMSPSAGCDIVTFVGQYKNMVLHTAWAEGRRGRFWQPSFWDHFLRQDEDLRATVEYVLSNPVRQGLVKAWQDYPFTGSLIYEDDI